MYLTYLWQSSGFSQGEAHERFSSILAKQSVLYTKAFGQAPSLRVKQIDNILIGQVRYESGVSGWEPWVDRGDVGIVWGGVCEDYLGQHPGTDEVLDIMRILAHDTKKVCDWSGMFSVIAWNANEKRVSLTTAATECPTLWYTEGKYGWASGPRGGPILDMVGSRTGLDFDAIGLYLLYGYFIGGHSPFAGVQRLRDRQQVTLSPGARPKVSTYVTLPEYMECGKRVTSWNESVIHAADRLRQRVKNQMKHSLKPVVLLTGGRDSRSIAAAARNAGTPFTTMTSGRHDSEDVIIAARVAGILGVEHMIDGNAVSSDLLRESMERTKLWVRINEGIIPLNYCLHLKDYFEGNVPFPAGRSPVFHGLEPGIGRGFYPRVGLDELKLMSLQTAHAFMTNNNRFLKASPGAIELLQDIYSNLDNVIRQTNRGGHQWFGLFLWRERGLIWGMDLQSSYGPIRWAWTPLFDRELIRLNWDLTVEQKRSGCLLIDAAGLMAPGLTGLACTQNMGTKQATFADRVRARVLGELARILSETGMPWISSDKRDRSRGFSTFWKEMFFCKGEHIWHKFIGEKDLLKIIGLTPENALLWRLATIDLLTDL